MDAPPPALTREAARAVEGLNPPDVVDLLNMLLHKVNFQAARSPTRPSSSPARPFTDNETVWAHYFQHRLPDTTRLTLEHFHLFDWFPLAPGRFHSEEGAWFRRDARSQLVRTEDDVFFNPYGKVNMIKGGVGAVRLASRPFLDERGTAVPHYLMCASSTSVCHEGVPVLVPRHLYRELIPRIQADGAAPVTIEGEMVEMPREAEEFLGYLGLSELPRLAVHAQKIRLLPQPRAGVSGFRVAVVVGFYGRFHNEEKDDFFMTYATFDPADQQSRAVKVNWIKEYVQRYAGHPITDFDELYPTFRTAEFTLERIMNGAVDPLAAAEILQKFGYRYSFGHDPVTKINQFNNYTQNIVAARGVLVQGDVGGHVITGDAYHPDR